MLVTHLLVGDFVRKGKDWEEEGQFVCFSLREWWWL